MVPLRLSFPGLPDAPDVHLSVDGMTPRGPNLSHWPGNRTPPQWKADLSTGICLAFARASAADQHRFLGEVDTVVNDHYDTDGFGSLLAILQPEVAFAREEVLLAAAACGDFGMFSTRHAFAIDRIVARIAEPHSPYAGIFKGMASAERCVARYRFLIEHAAALLDARLRLDELWLEECIAVEDQLRQARVQGGVVRRLHQALGFAILATRAPVQRMTLNTLAAAYRVLHVEHLPDGVRYRYHDRTESWFELQTIVAPPRRDLRPVAARLQALESRAGRTAGEWVADAPTEPIPELYHGVPAIQEYGQITRTLTPSALDPETVEGELGRCFAETMP